MAFISISANLIMPSTKMRPGASSFSRIFEVSESNVNLVRVKSDTTVSRLNISLNEIMKNLNNENGNGQKILHIRDLLRLFLPKTNRNVKLKHTSPFSSREFGFSAIMPRSKAKCYLLDLGLLNLLCCKDKVDILYGSTKESNRKNFVNFFVFELVDSLVQDERDSSKNVPFELHVLETALSCVVEKFTNQITLVEPLYDELIIDATSDPTQIKVGRMAAIKKSLFTYSQGVETIIQAIKELLSNDRDMANMYLDVKRDTGDHEEVEFLLEAYLADIQDCMNKAKGSGFLTIVIALFFVLRNPI